MLMGLPASGRHYPVDANLGWHTSISRANQGWPLPGTRVQRSAPNHATHASLGLCLAFTVIPLTRTKVCAACATT